jgi:hypothetical protein
MSIYIQIGAGAGDQDSRAGFRDGFSEYVKKLDSNKIQRIILVEPNISNILGLSECWKNYPQSEIYKYCIVPKSLSGHELNFFYAEDDAPHFQVASINPHHVLKHYPNLKFENLKIQKIPSIDLGLFLDKIVGEDKIELLSLDIEGIDAEVLLDTNLKKINVNYISFEHLHLGEDKEKVLSHFQNSGYVLIGNGIDHSGYDWLYQKKI